MKRYVLFGLIVAAVFGGQWLAGARMQAQEKAKPGKERLFELRTYHTHPGELDALNARFRNHTNKLFEKHGMTLVGYWTPAEGKEAQSTLVYILAYPDQQSKEKSWKAFRDDPEWKKVREESEKDGPIVEKVESVIMKPTDYSPMK
jgi:hypothetical protein